MHARRGFEEAKVTGAKSGHTLAETGLKFIEKEIKALTSDSEERHRLRLEKASPIWKEFEAWAEEQIKKVPKTSKIGEALNYFLDDYEWLTAYLKDGRLARIMGSRSAQLGNLRLEETLACSQIRWRVLTRVRLFIA